MSEHHNRHMSGQVVVITGASSGIGAAAARLLAAQGAHIVPVGRSPERTAQLAAAVNAEPVFADFADLAQVRRAARVILDRCPRIDVLVNNAGAVLPTRQLTVDGNEMTLQINHLAPHLLTTLLLPRLLSSGTPSRPARIVSTSSSGSRWMMADPEDLQWERRRYGRGLQAYSTAKLITRIITAELARRVHGENIHVSAVHPGVVRTRFGAEHPTWSGLVRPISGFFLTPEQGADPLVRLAAAPRGTSGTYFHRRREGRPHRQVGDTRLADRLWRISETLLGARSGSE
ncbi:SDR family NAD(P)-dependent oxidoreductase [Plantactinospora sonchi]|uniref:SDR family NAD(P)-dependent oxidoreductase n=1 Tax=Plantactinospora sonchi TaxID=1544735 RepID=A0ABU7RNC9_9ACTN